MSLSALLTKGGWLPSVCLALGIVSVTAASYLTYDLAARRAQKLRLAKEAALRDASETAQGINRELEQLPPVARQLAEDLSNRTIQDPSGRLEEIRRAHPLVSNLGVANGEADLPSYYEIVRDGAGWREPVWQGSPTSARVTYAAPFTRDGQAAGVVHLSIALDRVRNRIEDLEVGRTGWGLVVSQEGYVIVHPSEAIVRSRSNLQELVREEGDEASIAAVQAALRGKSGLLERANQMTGQASWFVYEPVPESGWSLILVRIRDEAAPIDQAFRRRVIWITIWAIVGLIGVSVWLAAAHRKAHSNNASLWAVVLFSSLLFLVGMAVIRRVAHSQSDSPQADSTRILDKNGLASFLRAERERTASQQHSEAIPTGLVVHTMKFLGAREIQVTGYAWQKFTSRPRGGTAGALRFPDAISSELLEAYHFQQDNLETVGWHFEAVLRQDMSLSTYPFDHELLAIRVWPNELGENVMLAPDLNSYRLTNPAALPGLAENVNLPGWDISGSFFSYKIPEWGADMGIPARQAGQSPPELQFNIAIKRRLFDATMSSGVPLLVVAAMLFGVVMTASKNEERSKFIGFNPSAVVRTTSALFFAVLLAHIQLRNSLEMEEVVLLDYSYFTIYITLLLVSLHTYLFHLEEYNVWIVEYRDSLILKLLYWPVLLGIQYVVTVALFY